MVTVADRFETLATAVAASYLNIPLVHVQGGEVTGSIDEKVRHAITKLADLHFVSTEKAAERVTRMGEQPERVFVTGCPSIDVVKRALSTPAIPLNDLFSEYGGIIVEVTEASYEGLLGMALNGGVPFYELGETTAATSMSVKIPEGEFEVSFEDAAEANKGNIEKIFYG